MNKGFTLVELMVVIVIMAIITMIGYTGITAVQQNIKENLWDGKVDAICFTAGGGENDPMIRSEVMKKLSAIGVKADEEVNNKTVVRKGLEGVVSSKDSTIPVYVLGTDEELMIARDTYEIVSK